MTYVEKGKTIRERCKSMLVFKEVRLSNIMRLISGMGAHASGSLKNTPWGGGFITQADTESFRGHV